MKITVDVDCTADEARRALGLPDLTPIHDAYIAQLVEMMKGGGVSGESLEKMIKSFAPLGEAGLSLWQNVLGGAVRSTRD